MRKLRMDEVKDDFKIYKNIFINSAAVMIFIVQVYVIIITNGVDIVGLHFIENAVLRIILQIIIQLIVFSSLSIVVFCVCYKFYEFRWIKKNKRIWFQGEWLHIHDKSSVRIGIVTIKQRFTSIEVKEARNISPNLRGIVKKPTTTWSYISATINPEEMLGVKLLGSYVASHKNRFKQGLHAFKEIQTNEDGMPYKMSGFFNDALEGTDNGIQDASDNNGIIYFLKVTPMLKRYIYSKGDINMNALANVLSNPNLKAEEFCVLLKEVVRKYGYTISDESGHILL